MVIGFPKVIFNSVLTDGLEISKWRFLGKSLISIYLKLIDNNKLNNNTMKCMKIDLKLSFMK